MKSISLMKKASIVSIGNELLNGQTVDTNAAYLSRRLLAINIPVTGIYTTADDLDFIVRALKLACEDGDLVMVTGGLGPTDDDVTRQGLAKFLQVPLQFSEELLQKIEDFFTKRNLQMPPNNKTQAYIPAGTKILENRLGTAAGIMAKAGEKLIFVMPGVPVEMKQMFEESVLPQLKKSAAGQTVVVHMLKCFGTGESNVAQMLGDIMHRGRNPQINCTVEYGVITLHIVATADNKETAERMVEKDEKFLRNLLGELVFGTGEQTLAQVVGEKLSRQKKTVAVAESCTGGILAKLLTDVPGASDYFTCGWITYSNEAKINELDVPTDLIEKYGAVSEQVAAAMAQSARKKAGSDFAIGITGIAGPTGGSEQKPVGLVYISIDSEKGNKTKSFIFSADRESVRLRAAQTALNILRLNL